MENNNREYHSKYYDGIDSDNDDDNNSESDSDDEEEQVNRKRKRDELVIMYGYFQTLVICNKLAFINPIKIDNKNINIVSINQKLVWENYVKKYGDDERFIKRHLRMSLLSFNKLLGYIREGLTTSEYHSRRADGVTPEICLFSMLRFLAGCSYLDLHCITGVSHTSFYRVSYLTMRQILKCPQLQFMFPKTLKDCQDLAAGFREISFDEAIINCIGCVDGYLLKICTGLNVLDINSYQMNNSKYWYL